MQNSYERLRTETRFETEAQENSEMAYSLQVPTCAESGDPGEKIKGLLIYYRCTITYVFFSVELMQSVTNSD